LHGRRETVCADGKRFVAKYRHGQLLGRRQTAASARVTATVTATALNVNN
jgi:hypothetical protein